MNNPPSFAPKYSGEVYTNEGTQYVALPVPNGPLSWVPYQQPPTPPVAPVYTGDFLTDVESKRFNYPIPIPTDDDDLDALSEALIVLLVDFSGLPKQELAKKITELLEEDSWQPRDVFSQEISALKRQITELQAPEAPEYWEHLTGANKVRRMDP